MAAMAAIGMVRPWPPTNDEMEDLIRIWDDEKFTPAEALDLHGMVDHLKPFVQKYVVDDPRI
jgi:hypothetical protein